MPTLSLHTAHDSAPALRQLQDEVGVRNLATGEETQGRELQ